MKYKCLIFDFDGTLANSENSMLFAYNTIADKYGFKILTNEDLDELKHMPFQNIAKNLGVPYNKIFSLLAEGQKVMKEHLSNIAPYDENLDEILINLKKLCPIMGIISSNTKKIIKKFLKTYQIHNMNFIVTSALFSKEVKIKKIMRKFRLSPEEVLYIGDEHRDIISSQNANVDIASATWGYNSIEYLNTANPTYMIDSINDLFEIIKES